MVWSGIMILLTASSSLFRDHKLNLYPRRPPDKIVWLYMKNVVFTGKNAYNMLVKQNSRWATHIPPKIRHFLWRALKNSSSIRSNLLTREAVVDITCGLCDIDHMLNPCGSLVLYCVSNWMMVLEFLSKIRQLGKLQQWSHGQFGNLVISSVSSINRSFSLSILWELAQTCWSCTSLKSLQIVFRSTTISH